MLQKRKRRALYETCSTVQFPLHCAPMNDYIRNLPQYLLPQRSISRCAYRLTRIRTPWFKNLFMRWFIQHFKVNMEEAIETDYRHYEHFNAFFTRALKADSRPLATEADAICCPIDGNISQIGRIEGETIVQAKGHSYTLTELLGGTAELAMSFQNGYFATLYLSPRDYHRIHMPLAGRLRTMLHVPGRLFSVSPLTTRIVAGLFARNERIINLFDSPAGSMAVIMVGAINVASMETVWAGVITPPLAKTIQRWDYSEQNITLEKGVEMGRFNMGSTVILLFETGKIRWQPELAAGQQVQMGQLMARLTL